MFLTWLIGQGQYVGSGGTCLHWPQNIFIGVKLKKKYFFLINDYTFLSFQTLNIENIENPAKQRKIIVMVE
jgi:hypothetical protein